MTEPYIIQHTITKEIGFEQLIEKALVGSTVEEGIILECLQTMPPITVFMSV